MESAKTSRSTGLQFTLLPRLLPQLDMVTYLDSHSLKKSILFSCCLLVSWYLR